MKKLSRAKKIGIGSAVLCVIAVLSILGMKKNAEDDMFAPIKSYVAGSRTCVLDAESEHAKYHIRAVHLKGITVEQAANLLESRIEKAGYSFKTDHRSFVLYRPQKSATFTPGATRGVSIGDTNYSQTKMEGVFVTEIRPMTIYDSVVAHLCNFRHPYVSEAEGEDNKKFFRE